MYRKLRAIHLWLSVPFGLIVSLICITGLIMLFEPAHASGGERSEFFLDVMRLHRWLFDAPPQKGMMTAGKMVVALSTCAMLIILITGILMWWQKARRGLSRSLTVQFHRGWKGFCYSFHSAGGMYVVFFLLIMALTGLTWSFGWYRSWIYSLFDIQKGSHIIYEIHTGGFGGIITKIIWGISVSIGFSLPLTGYYLWLSRFISARKNRKSKDAIKP